jgi:hypothetical protein
MRRKSFILALLVVAGLLGGVVTMLAVLARHEPAFYRRAAITAGPQRRAWSGEFYREFSHLLDAIQSQEDPNWSARFTTEQINSYLMEDFLRSRVDEKLLPDNVSDPRVAVDEDRFRLGFRYGNERWNTIITIDMRLWVAQGEVNTVGLELLGLHAGSLPISAQSLLEHVSEAARRNNIDVAWYRYEGHPVALLRFTPDQPRTSVHLKHIEVRDGQLVVQGRCIDSSPRAADKSATE